MKHPTKSSASVRKISAFSVAAALTIAAVPTGAQVSPQGGADIVRGFCTVLLSTMKSGATLGPSGRYDKVAPAVHQTFDIPFMTRLAVGPGWAALSPSEQYQSSEAFESYGSATYAERFDGYSGEQLQVAAGAAIVQTRIIKSNGEPISINYLMRDNDGACQMADVYLDGTISELATRRSEFASILRDQGIGSLIAPLNKKADLLSVKAARAG